MQGEPASESQGLLQRGKATDMGLLAPHSPPLKLGTKTHILLFRAGGTLCTSHTEAPGHGGDLEETAEKPVPGPALPRGLLLGFTSPGSVCFKVTLFRE